MFPDLSYIIKYLFGIQVHMPVQTFGFFEALAFVFAYFVFKSEFRRKELEGCIKAFRTRINTSKNRRALVLFTYGILGFLAGFKIFWVFLHVQEFSSNPVRFIFSIQGNLPGGLILAGIFLYIGYRNQLEMMSVDSSFKEVHPYQLMDTFVLWCAVFGFLGAKIFSCLENWDYFLYNPVRQFFSITGWTYYGGLVFGAITYLIIGYRHKMKLVHLADIGSPGMMLAYGIGRIGCHLSGDGDWGVVNTHAKPTFLQWIPDWAWSFDFPHNVLRSGIPLKNCSGEYCYVLPHGVFPTSLYEAVLCLALFAFLWYFRKRVHIPGLMFSLYLLFQGTERFFIEKIKVNPDYYLGHFSITQAEAISACMVLGGLTGILIILIQHKNLFRFIKKHDEKI